MNDYTETMYQEYKPDPALQDYIDAYWSNKGNGKQAVTETILPDGCVDIIINAGDDCSSDGGKSIFRNGNVYLVGTMTRFNKTTVHANTRLLGIRFKPAAFSLFYKFASLHEITDDVIELHATLLPGLQSLTACSISNLNSFFFSRLMPPKHALLPVISDIQHCQGQITIPQLSRRHFITARQLERNFKYFVGISPKEFIRLVRFRSVSKAIQRRTPQQSLMDIAFSHGYYDHSHLAHDTKRYTGITPSQL